MPLAATAPSQNPKTPYLASKNVNYRSILFLFLCSDSALSGRSLEGRLGLGFLRLLKFLAEFDEAQADTGKEGHHIDNQDRLVVWFPGVWVPHEGQGEEAALGVL